MSKPTPEKYRLPQRIKIESSGREVFLDAECDHDPEILHMENSEPSMVMRTYFWSCTECGKRVAPLIFAEHPAGVIARW